MYNVDNVYLIFTTQLTSVTNHIYRIVQNGGGGIFGELVTSRSWRGKLWRIAMSYPSLVAMRYAKFK